MNIYYTIIGQIVRFILRFIAGYLAFFEVTGEQQSELVEVTVRYLVPIIILAVVEGWSLLQKRFLAQVAETAIVLPPTASVEDAVEKTVAPVKLPY